MKNYHCAEMRLNVPVETTQKPVAEHEMPQSVYFENMPPSTDDDVKKLVRCMRLNYLRKPGISELPPGERIRMLRFVEARTRDNRRIDTSHVSTMDFLDEVIKKTHGLVMKLQEGQVRHVGFVGRRYELSKDSVWTRYLEEA
jgi:hypothetical protein